MLQQLFFAKDRNFLPLFIEQADCISRAGSELLAMLQLKDMRLREEKQKAISQIEHQGDQCVRQILQKLYKIFFAPYDHEDIKDLTLRLDDILDAINSVARLTNLYHLSGSDKYLEIFGQMAQKATSEVAALIHSMKNVEQCRLIFDKIDNIEHEADRILGDALYELFEKQSDALVIMKYKEIYEHFEEITDHAKDVADTVEEIVLEYM